MAHNTTTTPPRKLPNGRRRSREYLTPAEVDRLQEAAKRLGRHGHPDATMILLACRHGLRVSELIALRWDQVDLASGLLHVRRRKQGTPSTHPCVGQSSAPCARWPLPIPTCPMSLSRNERDR
ncbi:MAG TPA: tyrosine-type recombinase/integrase [Candidatus Tectomicrobia bacterium]|nr:tyrosine-type recombinase/integrase [Candidatus Tectomicrobia bacterium]